MAAPWLAQTKLRAPLPRADAVIRPRLLERLSLAVATAPLTLITAPAGSGKTTLLSSWLAQGPTPPAVAWLSLDPHDDDPALFLAGVAAALRRLAPAVGGQVEAMIATGAEPRAQLALLLGVLLDELDEQLVGGPALLVLDDLHALTDPAIHQAIGAMVERLPPALRLIIATRHDPPIGLPRLRARRLAAELRLDELRFTEAEAASLLNGRLGLRLSDPQVRAVCERTEGWAAGIGLLAGGLERRAAPAEQDRLIAGVRGSDRAIFDYLAEEVLERQDPFVRMFLLETAILPELSPAACAAVTGRDDAAAILDQLYRRNLFLVELDDAGRPAGDHAYRYHDLFAAFLRERLAREHPTWLRELHRRAARHAAQPARAVAHYLAAGQPDEAAAATEAAGEGLMRQGAFATLRQLVEALPPEARAGRPRLTALYALSLANSWQLTAARPWLERAARELAAAGDQAGRDALLAVLADTLRMLGDHEAARATHAAALAGDIPPAARARLLLSRAWQLLADGDGPGVGQALDAMLSLLEQSGDSGPLYSLATGYHSPFLVAPGGLALAERFCRLLAASNDRPGGPLQAANDAIGAWCAMLRGRPAEALALAERAMATSAALGGLPWLEIDLPVLSWATAGLWGDIDGAQRGYEQFLAQLERPESVAAQAWRTLYAMLFTKIAWLSGDARRFREAEARLQASAAPTEWPAADSLRACGQALVALDEREYARAEALLRGAAAAQERHREMRLGCDARLLLAHVYLAWQRPDSAVAALAPVLADHEREQTPGLLIFEGAPLVAPLLRLTLARGLHRPFAAAALGLFDDALPPRPPPSTELPEPLTARELEVLALLAAGASNQAIADTLVISLHTVKRHVTNILQKLDATSRLDAVARARARRLV